MRLLISLPSPQSVNRSRIPRNIYNNNIHGSVCLLDAMRRNGINTIVFSSTCATYGEVRSLPIVDEASKIRSILTAFPNL